MPAAEAETAMTLQSLSCSTHSAKREGRIRLRVQADVFFRLPVLLSTGEKRVEEMEGQMCGCRETE